MQTGSGQSPPHSHTCALETEARTRLGCRELRAAASDRSAVPPHPRPGMRGQRGCPGTASEPPSVCSPELGSTGEMSLQKTNGP